MKAILRVSCIALSILAVSAPRHAEAQILDHLQAGVPSPTASSLGKFGDIPVSLHTGVADITIPLHTAESRTLSLPITLKYHASGIRVEEVPGWVGAGWAIDAGGVITRVLRGLPDENTWSRHSPSVTATGYFAFSKQNTLRQYHSSIKSDIDLKNECTQIGYGLAGMVENREVDGEPDQFFYNFMGRSGEFVGGAQVLNGNIGFHSVPSNNLKVGYSTENYPVTRGGVTVEGGPRYDKYISSWTITDEDGVRYVFSEIEFTGSSSAQYPYTHHPDPVGSVAASAWYLTAIHSPTGEDVITLEYSSPYQVGQQNRNRKEWTIGLDTSSGTTSPTEIQTQSNTLAVRLQTIRTAREVITFNASLRQDVPEDYKLDEIVVRNAITMNVRRSFAFNSGGTERLFLSSVTEKGADGSSLRPYSFEYYDGLPSRMSRAVDHWGYANGITQNDAPSSHGPLPSMTLTYQDFYPGSSSPWTHTIHGSNRSASSSAVAGTLSRITYPTGGKTHFMYEPNDYSYVRGTLISADRTGGGIRIARIINEDGRGGWNEKDYLYRYDQRVLSGSDGTGEPLLPYEIWSSQRFDLGVGGGRSTGVIVHEPVYVYHHEHTDPTLGLMSYAVVADQSHLPLGSGYAVSYQAVTVLQTSQEFGESMAEVHVFNTANGHTNHGRFEEMEYKDPCYESPKKYSEWSGSARTNYSWLRGLALTTGYFNEQGQLVRRTVSKYDPAPSISPVSPVRLPAVQTKSFAGGEGARRVRLYEVISAPLALRETKEYACDSGPCRETRRTTHDNGYAHPAPYQLRSTTEEDVPSGTRRITNYTYAHRFYENTLPQLRTRNLLNAVYATTITDGSGKVLAKNWSSWRSDGAYVRPDEEWVWRGSSPTDGTAPASPSSSDAETFRVTRFASYDVYGRPTSQIDARGNTTYYYFGDNANNLSNTALGLNKAYLTGVKRGTLDVQFDYDPTAGQVSTIRNEAGANIHYYYDAFGRLERIGNAANQTVSEYSYYLTSGNPISDPSYARATQHVSGTKTYVTTSYVDGLGRPFQTQQQSGTQALISGVQYDRLGRLWKEWKTIQATNPHGFYRYLDAQGNWQDYFTNAPKYYDGYPEADALGRPFVEYLYHQDPLARVFSVVPPGESLATKGVQTIYGEEQFGTKWLPYSETINEEGHPVRTHVNGFGNIVRTRANGATTQFEYDALGNLVRTTDPRGLVTAYVYDRLGQLRQVKRPDSGTKRFLYDRNGNARYSQDSTQTAISRASFTTYDMHNRPLTVGTFPLGTNGAPSTFASLNPDPATAPAFETAQANWIAVHHYDASPSAAAFPWNQFERVLGSGTISGVSLTNAKGRLAALAYKSNGTWSAELYSYDADGRITNKYLYTSRIEEIAGTEEAVRVRVTNTFDRQNALTAAVVRVGTMNTPQTFHHWYDYDGFGRLSAVRASTGSSKPSLADVTYLHWAGGMMRSRQFRSHSAIERRYDPRDRLRSVGDLQSSTLAFSAQYSYFDDSTVRTAEFHQPGMPNVPGRYRYTYAYDVRNRLSSAVYSPFANGAYANANSWGAYGLSGVSYDHSGNLMHLARNMTGGNYDYFDYQYAPGTNRLLGVMDAALYESLAAFSYDGNGNIKTSNGLYSFTANYDEQNRPTNVGNQRYGYGPSGRRVWRDTSGGNPELFVSDRGGVLGVFGTGPVLKYWNIVLPSGEAVGRVEASGARRYYHTDNLGSVRSVVDANGTATERRDYFPFGLQMPGRVWVSGTQTREGYTGHELDAETGLNYAGARYYMARLGRWTAVDPLEDKYPGWSPYNYVMNNPTSLVDPTGRCPEGVKPGEAFFDDPEFGSATCMKGIEVVADRFEDNDTFQVLFEGIIGKIRTPVEAAGAGVGAGAATTAAVGVSQAKRANTLSMRSNEMLNSNKIFRNYRANRLADKSQAMAQAGLKTTSMASVLRSTGLILGGGVVLAETGYIYNETGDATEAIIAFMGGGLSIIAGSAAGYAGVYGVTYFAGGSVLLMSAPALAIGTGALLIGAGAGWMFHHHGAPYIRNNWGN